MQSGVNLNVASFAFLKVTYTTEKVLFFYSKSAQEILVPLPLPHCGRDLMWNCQFEVYFYLKCVSIHVAHRQ